MVFLRPEGMETKHSILIEMIGHIDYQAFAGCPVLVCDISQFFIGPFLPYGRWLRLIPVPVTHSAISAPFHTSMSK
jgi:hypothetical protein